MPGAGSTISIDGGRSEALAEYLFAAWGGALRGRSESDYGLDLYCTLSERVGKRAWVRANYTVQVKSNRDPWVFSTAEEVKWLVRHPAPIYLAVVEKAPGRISIYQTFARFGVWAIGRIPSRIELVPGTGDAGHVVNWDDSGVANLGPPIIQIAAEELFQDELISSRRHVLEKWINEEQWNLDLIRMGLLRLRAPHEYKTNSPEFGSYVEMGLTAPSDELLTDAVIKLREMLDCVGSQLFARGGDSVLGAVEAGLLSRWLERRFPKVFDGMRLLEGSRSLSGLYRALAGDGAAAHHSGIDSVNEAVQRHAAVSQLLKNRP